MKSHSRKLLTAAVLAALLISLIPIFSSCSTGIDVDTSGMYLVVYDGNGGYLGNKSSTVRKLFCQPGSKIPDYPVAYVDNQYTVPSLGLASREGYNLLGWYASDAATYKESELGEYVYLSTEEGNGIFEINPNGEYVRKYVKADGGEYVFVHVEEAPESEGAEGETAANAYVFINSEFRMNDEEQADAELPADDAAELPEEGTQTADGQETTEPDEVADDIEETDEETAEEADVVTLSVESGFYICNGEETYSDIDDENLREAYRRAFETATYTEAQVSAVSGWQKYEDLAALYPDVADSLDRHDYVFALAEEGDEGLDRYTAESGYASLYSIFVEDDNGAYVSESSVYVEYDPENEAHAGAQRFDISDRYIFTPDGDKTNPSLLTRYDATMDYWDFANDLVTEDQCEWDGEKYVLTLNAHWVKKNTVYYHYDNTLNQVDEQWTRLLADNITAIPLKQGEVIGRKEVVPQDAGRTFVAWSKTKGEYDPWDFENDLFPEGESELHLYGYYVDGTYTRITSASSLAGIGKNPDGNYLIVNNIDLGGKEVTGSLFGLSADSVFTGEILAFDKSISNFTLKLVPSKQQAMDSSIITSAMLIPQANGAKISGLTVDCNATIAGLKAVGVKAGQKKDIKFAVSPLFGTVLAGEDTLVDNCHISMTLGEKSEGALESDAYTYVINCGGYSAYPDGGALKVTNSTADFTAELTGDSVRIVESGN